MNDLPDKTQPTANPQGVSPSPGVTSYGGISSKETETEGISGGEAMPLKDVGTKEFELPKEVASVGVKIQSTSIKIPPKISSLGVKPSGASVPVSSGASVTLPLTDDQIVQGLKKSVTDSWRWLAVWCVRKLKQLHAKIRKT